MSEQPELAAEPGLAAVPPGDGELGSAAPLTGSERFLRAFLQHRPAVVSAGYLALLVLVALFGLYLVPHDPLVIDLTRTFEGPSLEYWLGTDHLGRSTLARIVAATAVALKAAALGVGIALGLGAPLGLLSGYFGGWWDRISMRIVEAIIALPALLVAIAILAILGPSLTNAMIALGIANATAFFRLMRGTALEVREAVYVDAARVSGAAAGRILFRHVLPNVTGPLTVQTTLTFAYVLLAEAGLSYIGLGVQPPEASWGVMLSTAQNYLHQHPFMVAPPGLMIVFSVLAFNLVGDGLRDALSRVEARPANGRRPGSTGAAPRSRERADDAAGAPLLQVSDLAVQFPAPRGGDLTVVSGVGFEMHAGRTVGLVGESGCGKSVTAMAVMGLLGETGRIVSGSIRFDGRELVGMPPAELNRIRGDEIGMIFQEPGASLNPAFTVKHQIAEALRVHEGMTRRQAGARSIELLDHVGIPGAAQRADDYPHQFSGGMAQRAMIAMALACNPKLLIADEPTTALDVTIQAQVLDLLTALQEEHGMAILLITHDLGVIADMCDEALVMYAGMIVERGPAEPLLAAPAHPYTNGLLASMPQSGPRARPQVALELPLRENSSAGEDQGPAPRRQTLPQIPGRVPPAWAWPEGCRFHPRCPHAGPACAAGDIPLHAVAPERAARCARLDEIDPAEGW